MRQEHWAAAGGESNWCQVTVLKWDTWQVVLSHLYRLMGHESWKGPAYPVFTEIYFSCSFGLSRAVFPFSEEFGSCSVRKWQPHMCYGCYPRTTLGLSRDPPELKSIKGGGILKPAYPLSLGIRSGLERTGVGSVKDNEQEMVLHTEAVLHISLREIACQREPAICGHKWEDKYKKCRCDQQRGRYITPERAAAVNGFGTGLFFPVESSLLFLSDVTLASSSEQYLMLLETYFSVSFLSDVG